MLGYVTKSYPAREGLIYKVSQVGLSSMKYTAHVLEYGTIEKNSEFGA